MKRDQSSEDRMIALTLKTGAYSAFFLIVAGLALHYAGLGDKVTTIGMMILLATPVMRIIVAGLQFLRERDLKYAWVSLTVLGVVALAYWLGA